MKNKINNITDRIEIRFAKNPIHKIMKTRRLKLLMTKLRAKNYLCFPRMDDPNFKSSLLYEVIILHPNMTVNTLALHARKGITGWSVWYEEDSEHMLGNFF